MEQGGYTPAKRRQEYGPGDGARMLRDLRIAAQQMPREEFNKIVNPAPVQLKFKFEEAA
jgi:hypothetical protein